MKALLWLAAAALTFVPGSAMAQAAPRTILFVGNSFTFGAGSPVKRYRAESVTDLNGEGIGGVPALFKRFTEEAGLSYRVSLETSPGKGFDWHVANRFALIDRRWDAVVLQGYSTLDKDRPGDPTSHVANAALLAAAVTRRNPRVDVELVSTWTRADQVYRGGSPWSASPVTKMAEDLRAASNLAQRTSPDIDGIVAVGEAWNRAFAKRLADPNPYDGISYGQIDLWTYDQYHASTAGYYLEALMVFGRVTGIDPRTLGEAERAADDLGLSPTVAKALQQVAAEQLAAR